ncbi:hypothetical protein CURTO8I2_60114 [Curtobacterium sp. 8I-2]|nr:hypothetical protein CURTO8I2_60114 [Curtobacterium sp. 8I-2]
MSRLNRRLARVSLSEAHTHHRCHRGNRSRPQHLRARVHRARVLACSAALQVRRPTM